MKTRILTTVVAAITAGAMQAAVVFDNVTGPDSPFTVGAAIPDGNPIGLANTRTISGVDFELEDVNVMINISGGFNGDLYGYLTHVDELGATVRVDLVNRVGQGTGSEPVFTFGYRDAGMHIILDQQAGNEIHTYQTISGINTPPPDSSTWNPDVGDLDSFNGMRANGDWILVLTDLSGGGQANSVVWGLVLESNTPVPEPTTWAGIIFATLFGGTQLVRKLQKRKVAIAKTES